MKRDSLSICLRLASLVKPLTFFMIVSVTLGVLGHLLATAIPVLGIMALIGEIEFDSFIIAILLAAVLRAIFRYIEQDCNHYIAFKILAIVRDKVFIALRRHGYTKLYGRDKGDLINVITTDVELLEVFFAHTISPIFIAIIYSVVMCVILVKFYAGYLLVSMLSYMVVGFFLPCIIYWMNKGNYDSLRNSAGELSSAMLEDIRGIDDVIQFNQGSIRHKALNEKTQRLNDLNSKSREILGKDLSFIECSIMVSDMLMLLVGLLAYRAGVVDFYGLIVPFVAFISSFGPCNALAMLGSTLGNTIACGGRILDILDEEPKVVDNEGEVVCPKGDILFWDATFGYDNQDVLREFNFNFNDGKIYTIFGKSGIGKSTLLKLIMRFFDLKDGKLSIDDVDIKDINTKSLRATEALVTQDTHIFNVSIKENIRLGNLLASDEEIINAAKFASIHEFITKLPQGYDTIAGELGSKLSAGERQRIGIARAFLSNAKILLFDEPTSNLDAINEGIILNSIKDNSLDKTVIMVSHRESVTKIADVMVEFKERM